MPESEHGDSATCADVHVYMCARESVWGLRAYVCTLTDGSLGWEMQTSLSQASTSAPCGPDLGEQRVPKSSIWDGGFCQIPTPLS